MDSKFDKLLQSENRVELVHCTPDTEAMIAFMARVSSPNQANPEFDKLIKYLIKNGHWSPFETASMAVQIKTTRGVAPQILRHRSFSFQEFSQRYAQALDYEEYPACRQDEKNRQNSIDDLDDKTKLWFKRAQEDNWDEAYSLYIQAMDRGIAKELARTLLPLGAETKLYMHGNIRSWIHYIQVRTHESTQKEHRDIALEVKKIFMKEFPSISKALEWE